MALLIDFFEVDIGGDRFMRSPCFMMMFKVDMSGLIKKLYILYKLGGAICAFIQKAKTLKNRVTFCRFGVYLFTET